VKREEDPPPVQLVAEPPPSGIPAFTASATPRSSGPSGGRKVGDRVMVRWGGTCYASRILAVHGPGSYLITYDGYGHSWDETVGESRICK
jgi:hypothetical protein